MILPSGTGITQADYDYLVSIIKPKRVKPEAQAPCWYCNNGHDRQYIEMGHLSHDLCECGATITYHPKHKTRKANPNAALAKELGARFNPYHQTNIKRMKALC